MKRTLAASAVLCILFGSQAMAGGGDTDCFANGSNAKVPFARVEVQVDPTTHVADIEPFATYADAKKLNWHEGPVTVYASCQSIADEFLEKILNGIHPFPYL